MPVLAVVAARGLEGLLPTGPQGIPVHPEFVQGGDLLVGQLAVTPGGALFGQPVGEASGVGVVRWVRGLSALPAIPPRSLARGSPHRPPRRA